MNECKTISYLIIDDIINDILRNDNSEKYS